LTKSFLTGSVDFTIIGFGGSGLTAQGNINCCPIFNSQDASN